MELTGAAFFEILSATPGVEPFVLDGHVAARPASRTLLANLHSHIISALLAEEILDPFDALRSVEEMVVVLLSGVVRRDGEHGFLVEWYGMKAP